MSMQSSSGQSVGQGTSQGSSNSSGQSNSFIPDFEPQLGFLQQFGNTAGNLASQQYDWANNQFANNQNLTDSNVNNYLQNSDMAGQAAQRDYSNYNDIFNPAASSLTQDWQSYASPDRVASEMGASEANVAQNFDAQRANTERGLRSYGVNPSDPRYAGAVAANRTAQAAAEAGAGTQARLNTEATGRQLRQDALNTAQVLPGQQATEQNVGMQGLTGAENAAMANTSMGALTLGTTPNYVNSGIADVKFQPLGTNSSNTSQSSNASQNTTQSVNHSSGTTMPSSGGGSSGSAPPPSSSGGVSAGTGNNAASSPSSGYNTGGQRAPGYVADPQLSSFGGPPKATGTGIDDQTTDPAPDNPWGALGPPSGDQPAYPDADSFAGGGAIPDGGGGGSVPPSMSPSGGQKVDDIPAVINQTGAHARLNADEFVIPQDVVQWMGHKFFQDLIMKSRKARMANPGPAHPTMGPGGAHHDAGGSVDPGSNSAGFQSTPTAGDQIGGMQMHDPGPGQGQGGFDINWGTSPDEIAARQAANNAAMQRMQSAGQSNGGGQSSSGGQSSATAGTAIGGMQVHDPGPSMGINDGHFAEQASHAPASGFGRTQHVAQRGSGTAAVTSDQAQGSMRAPAPQMAAPPPDQSFHPQPSYFTRTPAASSGSLPWTNVTTPQASAAINGGTPAAPSTPAAAPAQAGPAGWLMQGGRWVQDPNYTGVAPDKSAGMSINDQVNAGTLAQNGDGSYRSVGSGSETMGGVPGYNTGTSGISFNGQSTDQPGGATWQLGSDSRSQGTLPAAPAPQVNPNIQMLNGIPIDPYSGSMGGGVFTHLARGGAVPGRRRRQAARGIQD